MFFLSALPTLCRRFFLFLALFSLLFEQFLFTAASAANLPLAVDGSTSTSIDAAGNGVPIVNIAAPSASGLSHNRYSDFNVNESGLILNNSVGNSDGVVLSQIGGLINDNANLRSSGAASVILNEVTSTNVSRINGYVEIAGRKADLIIANPNGISFAGAGFVNVDRFLAVVGSPNFSSGNLNFSLSSASDGFLPQLVISGPGLNL